MPATAVPPIDISCIQEIRPTDRFRQGFLLFGNADNMNVIGHQAIAQHRQAVGYRLLLQYPQILPLVLINKEHILLIIATLTNMMRQPRHNYSR